MQRVISLLIIAFSIFCPPAAFHAGIGTRVYFAKGLHTHKKRIAAKPEFVQGVVNQLLLHRYTILLPFAL